MLDAIEKRLRQITRAVALLGGAGFLFAIAATCLSIAGKLCRRALNAVFGADFNPPALAWIKPVLGEEEITQYAVGLGLFAALPWATLQGAHLTVDLFKNKFGPRLNGALDFLGQLIFAVVVGMILRQQWFLIFYKAGGGRADAGFWGRLRWADESQILGIKLLPLHAAAELCVALLFVVCVFCVLRAGQNWRRAWRGGI